MLTYFKCQNGNQIRVIDCLEHCPQGDRCLSLPTLTTIGQVRQYKGTPSTTQLLNPTRIEYLQITKPFAVDPFDRAFALLGTRHHSMLDTIAKKIEGLKSEMKLEGEILGTLDLLEPIDGSDEYRLIDYKTYGSYAVAKLLNLKDEGKYDRQKLTLQLNNYRLLVRDYGFKVKELKCQITVRDGNTFSARNNKVDRNLYMIPVEIMDDNEVKEYFLTKSYALKTALEKNELPEPCPYDERWGVRRCKGYCSVIQWCPEGAMVNKVKLEE